MSLLAAGLPVGAPQITRIDSMSSLRNRLMIGLGLGVLAMVGLALWADLPSLRNTLGRFDWRLFPLVLGCTLFNYTLRFFKWHYYVRLLGVRTLSASRSARLFVAGFPLAFTPGKAGEALKAVWLAEWTGLPFASGLPIVIAERISDGLAVMALSALGVFTYPQFWPGFLAIVLGVLGLIVVSQIRPLALAVLGWVSRLPVLGPRVAGLRAFYESSYRLFKPRPLVAAVGLGTISWLGEGVGFFIILAGLGLDPSPHLLILAIFVLAFSTIVGAVSALPGGVGAVEATLTGLLVLAMHPEHSLAGTATILIRLGTLWFGMALGLGVWATTPTLWKIHDRAGAGNVAG